MTIIQISIDVHGLLRPYSYNCITHLRIAVCQIMAVATVTTSRWHAEALVRIHSFSKATRSRSCTLTLVVLAAPSTTLKQ